MDLTGQKFGKLTVMYMNGKDKYGIAIAHCKCDCGNEKDVLSNNLKRGSTKSCGCNSKVIMGTIPNRLMAKISKRNTSGVKGVSFYKNNKKWVAKIGFQGAQHHLGYFDTLQEAADARIEAEKVYFDSFLASLAP